MRTRSSTAPPPVARAALAALAAFSVIEIMVAVSLLAVIIVGLLAMFYQVQRAFRQGTAQVDVMEGGRAIMGFLNRELQQMAPTDVAFTTNCLIINSESPVLRAATASTTQTLSSGDVRTNLLRDLVFISKVNDEWQGVAYRISNSVSGVGTLYRMVMTTNDDSNPEIAQIAVSNMTRRIMEIPLTDLRAEFHPVLDGVVHFSATAYDRGGEYQTNAVFPSFGLGFAYLGTALPSYLDLELGALETGAVEKFRARAEVNASRAATFLEQQAGRTHLFRQRVAVKAGSAAN